MIFIAYTGPYCAKKRSGGGMGIGEAVLVAAWLPTGHSGSSEAKDWGVGVKFCKKRLMAFFLPTSV